MEGKNPGEQLAAKVIDAGKQQLPRKGVVELVAEAGRNRRKTEAAFKGIEAARREPSNRKYRLDTGEVTYASSAGAHVGQEVERRIQDEMDEEGTLQSDTRFVEPLAVLTKEGRVSRTVTPKQESPKNEVGPYVSPVLESPATPEEFKEITGVENRLPDALGVAITPAILARHRARKAQEAKEVALQASQADRTSKMQVARKEVIPEHPPQTKSSKYGEIARSYGAKSNSDVAKFGRNRIHDLTYSDLQAKAAATSRNYREAEETAARVKNKYGNYPLRDSDVARARDYAVESASNWGAAAQNSEKQFRAAEKAAGERAMERGEYLPQLTDEALAKLLEDFYANSPGYFDVLKDLQEQVREVKEEVDEFVVDGRKYERFNKEKAQKPALSKKARVLGLAVLGLTALIRRDALTDFAPAQPVAPVLPAVTEPMRGFPVARDADTAPIEVPMGPAVPEASKAPAVERIDYKVGPGEGLSAILNNVNPGRYKEGDDEFASQGLLHEDLKQTLKINRERLLDINDAKWHEGYQKLYDDWDSEVARLGRELSGAEFRAFLQKVRGPLFGSSDEKVPLFAGLNLRVPQFSARSR